MQAGELADAALRERLLREAARYGHSEDVEAAAERDRGAALDEREHGAGAEGRVTARDVGARAEVASRFRSCTMRLTMRRRGASF